jgi:hypothetical protein
MAGGGEARHANPIISALFEEHRVFAPLPEFAAQAAIRDRALSEKAERDPEAFWAEVAGQRVRAQPEGPHEVLPQNFSGLNRIQTCRHSSPRRAYSLRPPAYCTAGV